MHDQFLKGLDDYFFEREHEYVVDYCKKLKMIAKARI
jgi:hypothetical protein